MSSLINFVKCIQSFNINNYNNTNNITNKKDKDITPYTEKSLNSECNKLNYRHEKLKRRYKSYDPFASKIKESSLSCNEINDKLAAFMNDKAKDKAKDKVKDKAKDKAKDK